MLELNCLVYIRQLKVDRTLDVEKALIQLKPAERLCIVLAYSERMSHGEIRLATGLPLGTVKSHISRGAEKLRRYLKDYKGEL